MFSIHPFKADTTSNNNKVTWEYSYPKGAIVSTVPIKDGIYIKHDSFTDIEKYQPTEVHNLIKEQRTLINQLEEKLFILEERIRAVEHGQEKGIL